MMHNTGQMLSIAICRRFCFFARSALTTSPIVVALTTSCSSPAGPPGNRIEVGPNPNSALSALVTFSVPGAASASVKSIDGTDALATPLAPVAADGGGTAFVLGLSPSTAYAQLVLATMPSGAIVTTPSVSFTTGALPSDLTNTQMAVTPGTGAPRDGYYLVSGGGNETYAVDSKGTIRWYRAFGQATQEAKMQYDGSFTTYAGTSTGSQPVAGQYVRYTGDGTEIAHYSATSPDTTEPDSPAVYTDPHELLITTDASGHEHIHLIAYELKPTSEVDSGIAIFHELVRQSPDGTVEFQWKTWSRFSLDDQTENDLGADVDHMNAIAIDPLDGNYVLSLRSLDAIVKIDAQTGDTIWQLGGKQGSFAFVGDPLAPFHGQHSVRVLANGNLLIYDNGVGRSPPGARAVEYALDTSAMTATLVWQFIRSPAVATPYVGSVERLANGNTLVAFGWVGIVDEVDPHGNVVWEGQLENGTSPRLAYRVRRLPSLYGYATP